MHAIGIDVGSTNVKAALVDDSGALVGSASRPLRTVHRDDAVVQDPDELWAAVRGAVRELTAAHPAAAAGVATIGVCSQYSSIVPVDRAGDAVGPILMYLDLRGTDRCWQILEEHPDAFDVWIERHGIPPIGGGLSLGHLLHLQHDEPRVHERTAAHLEVVDLVNLRLTGVVAATQCTMFAAQLCDNRTVGTTRYDDELVRRAGIDASRLPPLIDIDGTVGTVRAAVAEDLGLPAGVEVRAGMNDTQAGAFATGTTVARDGRCGVVIGTTAVLIRPLDSLVVDLEHEVLAMPAPVRGRYISMAENGVAGRSVEQALSLVLADLPATERFERLEAAIGATAAGAGGVLFLPWLAGSMSPSSSTDVRGGFVGLSLDTSPDDLLRSTVEGVARNLRWLAPALDGLVGGGRPRPADRYVLAGGAARSPAWVGVVADVLGAPVDVLEHPEVAAARATAAVALCRTAGADPDELAVPVAHHRDPDAAATAEHDRIQPAFEGAFTAIRTVCQALRP